MTERDIPRVWEVDWAIPPAEGGTPWEAYDWLLETADQLGATEVSIVASTYDSLGHLNWAIGASAAQWLRVQPHEYRVGGITVRGVSRRGFWHVRGPVLVAWPDNQVMAEIEGKRPAAIAAVAQWPDDIATWRSVYGPTRIGQVRPEQEAEFDTATIGELDPQVGRDHPKRHRNRQREPRGPFDPRERSDGGRACSATQCGHPGRQRGASRIPDGGSMAGATGQPGS